MSTGIEDWSPPPDDNVYNSGDVSDNTAASPGAGGSIGDWGDLLGKAGDFASGLAKTAGSIISARDAAVDRAQQRSYDQAFNAAKLDLARASLDTNSQIAKLNLQGTLAKAQQQLRYITTGQPGSFVTIALIAGGIYLFVHRKG